MPKPSSQLPAAVSMAARSASVEAKIVWTGRLVSVVPALMLFFSAAMKLTNAKGVEEGFAHLGWPLNLAGGLAFLEISCAIIYLIPRSAVMGAILLTALFGGAMATHIRVGDPMFIQMLLTVFVWGGLYLREPKLRALIPWRR